MLSLRQMNYLPLGIDSGYFYTVTMSTPSITHFPFFLVLFVIIVNEWR